MALEGAPRDPGSIALLEGGVLLEIGESTYRLVGIDTNVISEVLREQGGARRGFISRFASGHIACFSVYSTFELRQRPDIYEEFLEFFDIYPCMLLKNEEQLFEDELAAYPTATHIDPTLWGFSHLNTPKGTNLKNLMEITSRPTAFASSRKPHAKTSPSGLPTGSRGCIIQGR